MPDQRLNIGFVRRGYSVTGGAEAYLQRLARGVVDLGHRAILFTTNEWPAGASLFGEICRVRGDSPRAFADDLERFRARDYCDVLMSFERVWRCDVYRAGDGSHRAWLKCRKDFATPWQNFSHFFNRKHDDILRLEKSLFADRGADRVIANSQMVKKEIVDLYNYPADKIDIVHNGVPTDQFRFDLPRRQRARADLELRDDEIALLFVGTGWERKGLRFAIQAVEACGDSKMRLFVAGRGAEHRYRSPRVQFLGQVVDLAPIYAAADIFLLPTIYDPFSNACLEALASGLPVITTRSNGFSEIVEDKVHGSIVDLANDVSALREAILFWSDEMRRSSARSIITQRAAQFDISTNVEQTLAILLQVAARAASA